MAQKDYYQTLGIDEGADAKQIRNAYRELAFQYHPDRNRDNPEAAERMKQVNEAYAVLSDPSKRSEYDSMRQRFGGSAYGKFRNEYSEQDIFSGSDINRVFNEIAKTFGYRGVDEVFSEFYGKGYKNFEFKRPGFFAAGFLFSGFSKGKGTESKKLPLGGLGNFSRLLLEKITGVELPANGKNLYDIIRLTPHQAETGGPYAYFLKKMSKKLVVKIPAGIREGQKIRLAGMGEPGKNGGVPGNLYLKVVLYKPWQNKMKDFAKGIMKKLE